jgi:hypothetical protein
MRAPESLQDYCDLLDAGTPFTQANYCDGEWLAIMGRTHGAQCDGQSFNDTATRLLRKTLRHPRPYWHGVMSGDKRREPGLEFCRSHRYPVDDIQWVDKALVYGANVRGEAGPFWGALARRRVLVVGPEHLTRLPLFDPVAYVNVPSTDAMDAVDQLSDDVLHTARAIHPDVITFSASFAAKVLIWRLWPTLGDHMTLLDIGSMYDAYCGVRSRGHAQKVSWDASMAANIAGMSP